MAEKPQQDFGRRRQISVPPSPTPQPPGKRTSHVALLVMGTLAVGGTACALMPRECAPAQPGAPSPAECTSRGSSSGPGRGSSRLGYSSGGSSSSTAATTADGGSGGVKRGGFGAFAHSFSSHFSFGG